MFCIYCGNKVEATEESCSSCGNAIYKETPIEIQRFPETSNEAFIEIEMKKAEETTKEFRIISGSEAMLRRIPLKSPRES